MKVKNIAFSGFMAAILMAVSGVAGATTATVNLVSKKYVDDALALKQGALTPGEGIEIKNNVIKSVVDTTGFVKNGELPDFATFVKDEDLQNVKKVHIHREFWILPAETVLSTSPQPLLCHIRTEFQE